MPMEQQRIGLPWGEIDTLVGGSGPTLVLLHRDIGRPQWGELQDRLSRSFRLVMPSLPGFDASDRLEWLRNVPDLAAVMGRFLATVSDGPVHLAGLGFGGWLAAEIAAREPERVDKLFLHAAVGIKPTEGEIADFILWETLAWIRYGFASDDAADRLISAMSEEQRDCWENNRDMLLRVAWKPAMYDPALPDLLRAAKAETLVAWSGKDRIVPSSVAKSYLSSLPNAREAILKDSGHHADIETPDQLAELIEDHFAATSAQSSRLVAAAAQE